MAGSFTGPKRFQNPRAGTNVRSMARTPAARFMDSVARMPNNIKKSGASPGVSR